MKISIKCEIIQRVKLVNRFFFFIVGYSFLTSLLEYRCGARKIMDSASFQYIFLRYTIVHDGVFAESLCQNKYKERASGTQKLIFLPYKRIRRHPISTRNNFEKFVSIGRAVM